MTKPINCRYPNCRQEIQFLAHWATRKVAPYNAQAYALQSADPSVALKPDGEFVPVRGLAFVDDKGLAVPVSRTRRPAVGTKLYRSHYASCPEGKTMREYQQAKAGNMAAVRKARVRTQLQAARQPLIRASR